MKLHHVLNPESIPTGDRRDGSRRREDKWRVRLTRFWMAVITGMWLWTALALDHQLSDLRDETKGRINATCMITEKKQAKDVDQLRATYAYLQSLTPKQRRESLNRAILLSLPGIEADAHIDDAPAYCDKPGVGEPEPDPVIPKRPEGLTVPKGG